MMKQPAKRTPGSRSPNDIDVAVGIKLRKLRLEANLTLQDLADQIGTSHQQLQKYETGVNRVSVGMLPIIGDALGVDINQFFADAQSSGSEKKSPEDKLRAECEAALRRLKSEDTLRAMLKVIKAMAD
jgi:transcriptional regulator with XRE-family HTH domain